MVRESLIRFKRIPSTNTKASQLAQRGEPEWTVVVSEIQTRGRGREGKKWESGEGGLWFSVILRPEISPKKVGVLQLFCAVEARSAIEREASQVIGLKWPNDLIADSRKLGGILVETKVVGETLQFAVAGIGLNVNQTERGVPEGAVSLRSLTGRKFDLERLLQTIVLSMRTSYKHLDSPSRLIAEWWANCVHREKRVMIQGRNATLEGSSEGVDDEGRLLLRTVKGLLRVSEGHLVALND